MEKYRKGCIFEKMVRKSKCSNNPPTIVSKKVFQFSDVKHVEQILSENCALTQTVKTKIQTNEKKTGKDIVEEMKSLEVEALI